MLTFKIDRYYANEGEYKIEKKRDKTFYSGSTLGIVYQQDSKSQIPLFYSLERPLLVNGISNRRDNKQTNNINESCCIPVGEYLCEWKYSPRLKRNTYLLIDVFGRDSIRLHTANDIEDLLGCITFGLRVVKNVSFDNKNYFDYIVSESRQAFDKFEKITQGKNIKLIISDLTQERVFRTIKNYNQI